MKATLFTTLAASAMLTLMTSCSKENYIVEPVDKVESQTTAIGENDAEYDRGITRPEVVNDITSRPNPTVDDDNYQNALVGTPEINNRPIVCDDCPK